ncbi:MAG: hypothetical protein K6G45_04135 [Lachnospiraceae bacterium]|nr:hypothetical protein [Lachnospiraceae bacterium]
MGLFRNKTQKELDGIIERLQMNMANNYKDNAQSDLKELEGAIDLAKEKGSLKPAVLEKYETILGTLKERLKGYSHKDQKPYWSK